MEPQHNPDTNENAARIVAGSQARQAVRPGSDVEAAWREWSSHVQDVDQREMSRLRQAFGAGWDSNANWNKTDQ